MLEDLHDAKVKDWHKGGQVSGVGVIQTTSITIGLIP